jgi:hypothetical protein
MKMNEIEGFRNLKNQFEDQTKGFIGKYKELEFKLKVLL